jgi:hypothetical protein
LAEAGTAQAKGWSADRQVSEFGRACLGWARPNSIEIKFGKGTLKTSGSFPRAGSGIEELWADGGKAKRLAKAQGMGLGDGDGHAK